jgi:imidazolonepropionase-like amidohydrolase
VHIAIEEGIKLLTGTDIPPAETEGGINITLKEMEYLVDVGLSPLESIQTATLNPAELMRIGNEIGAVEPGYDADLIAVRQNPLKDIRAIRDTFFVMQSGKAIRWDQQ